MELKLVEMLFIYVKNEIIVRGNGHLYYYNWEPCTLILFLTIAKYFNP